MPQDSIFYGDITVETACSDSADEYWLMYFEQMENFGPIAMNLLPQLSGQGASDHLHNTEKCISTKTRSKLGHTVKESLTEVKMAAIHKRSELVR